MPRTARVKGVVQSRSSRSGQRRRPHLPVAVVGAVVLASLWAASYTSPGRFATAYLFVILNFYIGVISLVALSLTVLAGLVSTDRVLLRIGHRVLFQGVHRATAIIAMVALGVHIAVKVLAAHAAVGDAVVPFYSQGRSLFIGFGTIAAYLMLLAFWSGLARTGFLGSARRWLWRTLHCSAYLSWLVALVHGLNAGRPAAHWVTVSYGACVVFVVLGLLVRLYTKFGRYATGVKTQRPVGLNAQTAAIPRIQDTFPPSRVAAGSPVGVASGPRGAAVGSPAGYYEYHDEPRYQAGPSRYEPAGSPAASYPTSGEPWPRSAPVQTPAAGRDDGRWQQPEDDYYPTPEWESPAEARPRLRLVASNDTAGYESEGAHARGRHSAESPYDPDYSRPGPYPPAGPAPGSWSPPGRRSRRSTMDGSAREGYRAG